MPREALVKLSNPQYCSRVSRSERIPCNANRTEAFGSHVLKNKNQQKPKQKHNMFPYCLCSIIQVSGSDRIVLLAKIFTAGSCQELRSYGSREYG